MAGSSRQWSNREALVTLAVVQLVLSLALVASLVRSKEQASRVEHELSYRLWKEWRDKCERQQPNATIDCAADAQRMVQNVVRAAGN